MLIGIISILEEGSNESSPVVLTLDPKRQKINLILGQDQYSQREPINSARISLSDRTKGSQHPSPQSSQI